MTSSLFSADFFRQSMSRTALSECRSTSPASYFFLHLDPVDLDEPFPEPFLSIRKIEITGSPGWEPISEMSEKKN
ncbi:hypothetical protein QQF64_025793 [Cirrhinus molitorella]|uniref:Uncharacterized protein n=1 Tax=Cirrhinus molitorella TaxID=172907 RepID=A0ABR3NPZ1_9TELE